MISHRNAPRSPRWRVFAVVAALWPVATAHAQTAATRWMVCTRINPGYALARPFYRDCRPLPAACQATPTCACMARAMPDPFRFTCVRVGHRFIRRMVNLP